MYVLQYRKGQKRYMIVFNNVTKYYKSNVGIENVSVKINKGDFVFLVGPSGAGKSTFIKLILKEIDADSGSIKVRGNEVTTLSNRQVPKLRRNIGIVFQDFRLLPKDVYKRQVRMTSAAISARRETASTEGRSHTRCIRAYCRAMRW